MREQVNKTFFAFKNCSVKKSEPTIIFNLQTNKIRKKSLIAIWPIVILGEIGLCLNMALVPKILIDCVVPNRRSLASGKLNLFRVTSSKRTNMSY